MVKLKNTRRTAMTARSRSKQLPGPHLYFTKDCFTIVHSFIVEVFSPSISAGSLVVVQCKIKIISSRAVGGSSVHLLLYVTSQTHRAQLSRLWPTSPVSVRSYVHTPVSSCRQQSLSHCPKLQSSSRIMCSSRHSAHHTANSRTWLAHQPPVGLVGPIRRRYI